MKAPSQENSTDIDVANSSTQPIVIVCGSDIAFPNHTVSNIIQNYLVLLKHAVGESPSRVLCFTPAPYGTGAMIQSTKEFAFAHHTLPCPSIPIPRGADFIGRHVSQVEADVHLPLPDAYRTFQLQQSIRSLQRAGEAVLLHAHTPGVIGFHLHREALKRRLRGKPIPLVATHSTRYQPFVETRIAEIASALHENHALSLSEFFTHGGLFERLIPILHEAPDLRAGIERLISETRSVVHHWYSIPNASDFRANRRWGQILLWFANVASRYSHHRLQGSLAAANAVHELAQLVSAIVGVPLLEIWRRPSDSRALVDGGIKDLAGQLLRGYLSRFYGDCDRVLNFEGESGRADLQSLGLPTHKITDINLDSSICDQLSSIYAAIVSDSDSRVAPKRVKLSDFEWGPQLPGQPAAAHLAMSDVHLGDGSGTERAIAAMELKPHFERLKIECIEMVGDLIQRDVSSELSTRHRESFLSAMRLLTTRITDSVRPVINLKVELDPSLPGSSKRYAEVRKELQSFAIRMGARIEIDDTILGVPIETSVSSVPVYIERGNHDEGERLEEVIPGSIVSSSMIRLDRSSGVLFCHGNIWNLPEVPLALKQANSFDELAQSLTESQLRSSLETAQVIYSMTSALWRACAKRIDIRGLWKNDLQPSLSKLVQWHRDRSVDATSSPSEYSQFLSGVISPVDNATVAAQCGIAVRGFGEFCWAVCDGHSHRPSIEFLTATNPQTGTQSGTLLVNCGKFHGKNITVVMLRFPEAVIFEWDEREQTYYVLMRRRLSEEEIRIVTDPVGRGLAQNGADALTRIFKERQTTDRTGLNTPHRVARTILEVCTEGSGHNERQLALLPLYEDQGTVHVAASGDRSLQWAHEHWPGHRMVYDEAGSLRTLSTTISYFRRQYPIRQKAIELAKTLTQYTHAITDFAPILPLAMQLARTSGCKDLPPLFHVSHHAAMHSRYRDTPRPPELDRLTYWATQRYLNSIMGDVNIGFHFERYHADILPPPIGPDMLTAKSTFNSNIVLVYLNGAPSYLAEKCGQIDPTGEHEWHIYSSQQQQLQRSRYPHIWQFPSSDSYREKLPHARAVLTLSGFMGPAELLYLGKPFIAVPTPGHGEHAFNAAALREISDVTVVNSINDNQSQQLIRQALGDAKAITQPLKRTGRMGPIGQYKDVRFEVIRRIYGD
jgi:hypothetical protein